MKPVRRIGILLAGVVAWLAMHVARAASPALVTPHLVEHDLDPASTGPGILRNDARDVAAFRPDRPDGP